MSHPIFSRAFAFCFVLAVPFARAESLPRSISTSRQFVVYAPDARLRGVICDLAEQTKSRALRLLHEKDAWRTPILVNAQYPQANLPGQPPSHLNFSQTGAGLKLQLDLCLTSDNGAPAIERALLRAIYLEMSYRQKPETPAGTAFVEPPDWLLEGTLALANERATAAAAARLRTIAASGHLLAFADFLQQRPVLLDAESQAIHRAYSAALVATLSETPGGPERLARFVSDLPQSSNDPVADFRAHFPMFDDDAIDRVWNRAVAHWSLQDRARMLDCPQTERQLAQVLRVELRESDSSAASYTLEEFPKFARLADAPRALQSMNRELLLLAGRAHPIYLPVILEYQKISSQLAHRKTKGIAQRLAQVRASREAIARTMEGIGDYLNWFEATQAQSSSGMFRDYLRTAAQTAIPQPRRRDPISVYLDSIEALMPRPPGPR